MVITSTPLSLKHDVRPFSVIRFCCYLFGVVILFIMLETLIALTGCTFVIVVQARQEMGACSNMSGMLKDIFGELLTGILALLAASRSPPPPPPSE
jgi:hypothetical protein